MLVIGEKNIFGEIAQIIGIASEANTILQGMLNECKDENKLDAGMQAIHVLRTRPTT